MGGVVGTLSAKFALTAGTLLLATRVDMHRAMATLDPSLPTTEIGAGLAQRLGIGGTDARRRYVDLGHSTIRIGRLAVGDEVEPPVRIGADVLREIVLLLDLRTMRLELLDGHGLRHATQDLDPVAASTGPDGCVTIAVSGPDGRPLKAALIGTAPKGETPIRIRVGSTNLDAGALPAGRCRASDLALGWDAFVGSRVVLDLRHQRIWLPKAS